MAHICVLHCIGVLVIDEIQRMKKGEAAQQIIDFFVELSNKLGVPLIYIGTYKAVPIFNRLLANGRRASGMGAEFLDPMRKGDEWDLFLGNIWGYQWTKTTVPLTKELNDTMYELTQGVTDFVINLFIKAQQHAIAFGKEKLTKALIRHVALHNLRLVQDIINALRTGDKAAIEKYDDLKPGWVETNKYIEALGARIGLHGKISEEHKRAISSSNKESNFQYLIKFSMDLNLSEKESHQLVTKAIGMSGGLASLYEQQLIVSKMIMAKFVTKSQNLEDTKKESNKVVHFPYMQDVRLIEHNAKKAKVSIVQALKEENIVKSFAEFINEADYLD
jgi:hypothetical protein